MSRTLTLPGGPARRTRPVGVAAGAPLTRIDGPAEALGLVSAELQQAESHLQDLVVSDVAAVPVVAGYLLAAGGKRLRPALTALGARAVGDTAPISRLMCAGELLHLGSLLHDDVVDQGELRRGLPATHLVYGNAVSVLTGDFCLARSVLLAAEEGGHAAVTGLARAVTEMAEGEVLQLQRAGDLSTPRAVYLDIINRKSAALIAWCASAAALRLGDADAATALETFGRGVGIAFQITDDVLDFRPGTGKAVGNDVRERKATLPLLLAIEARPDLRARLEADEPTAAEVQAVVGEVTELGALDAALDIARDHMRTGLEALHRLPPSDGRAALEVLGHHLVERAQ